MDLKNQGILIDRAINAFHQKVAPPILPRHLERIYAAYVADTENDSVYSVQDSIKYEIDGSLFIGRADQLRRSPKGLCVWDVKYSQTNGVDLINKYLPSLMVYAYGLGVRVGGIVNVKNYNNRLPVFHYINAPKPTFKQMRLLVKDIQEENNRRK